MLLDTKREVALLIELAHPQAVARGFEGYGQKVLRCFSPQGKLGANWLLLFYVECGQSLLGHGANWLLFGDRLHDSLGVHQPLTALSYPHMHDDLVDAGLEHYIHLAAPSLMTGLSVPII